MMVDECRRVGIPDPEFHCDGGFVWVIFHYTRNIAGEDRPSTDQVMTLVKELANEEMSVKEIMEKLGLNHRPTFRSNYLHPALNEGFVVPVYPDRPKHPRQKYRLTEKGKALLIPGAGDED